ncbi:hypothetical protein RRG08_039842 [Elysia crispata]|uniref:Uncharacterized protein n=1 Tax=Elysia crispata TaxID=231223 RepID=A0AAE1DMX1_9GAST|nr:hypothetical protein RRG08_039842 [Elysia crispata]
MWPDLRTKLTVLTDEVSAGEDGVADNLSGNQLRAPYLLTISSARCDERPLLEESESKDEEYQPTASSSGMAVLLLLQKDSKLFLNAALSNFQPLESWVDDKDLTPPTLFELFFDAELVSFITDHTNM